MASLNQGRVTVVPLGSWKMSLGYETSRCINWFHDSFKNQAWSRKSILWPASVALPLGTCYYNATQNMIIVFPQMPSLGMSVNKKKRDPTSLSLRPTSAYARLLLISVPGAEWLDCCFTPLCNNLHTCIHIHMFVWCMCIYIYPHTYICVCVREWSWVYITDVCVYMYIHRPHMHIYLYTIYKYICTHRYM